MGDCAHVMPLEHAASNQHHMDSAPRRMQPMIRTRDGNTHKIEFHRNRQIRIYPSSCHGQLRIVDSKLNQQTRRFDNIRDQLNENPMVSDTRVWAIVTEFCADTARLEKCLATRFAHIDLASDHCHFKEASNVIEYTRTRETKKRCVRGTTRVRLQLDPCALSYAWAKLKKRHGSIWKLVKPHRTSGIWY